MTAMDAVIIEMWTEYAIGMLFLMLRIYTRCKVVVGWRWQGDDFLALACMVFFTLEVSMCQIISSKGSITGMTEEVALGLTSQQYLDHETGAKWLFSAWFIYASLVWTLKGIMLFFFTRLTKTSPEQRLVKWISIITIAAYVATIGAFLGHWQPVNHLWQVYPLPSSDCSENTSKYYALVTTNVTTDLLIMYIPIPLLWRLQTTLRRKFFFGVMFCAGGFIIVCTLLRCILCLQQPSRLDLGLTWSIRETVIAILATNVPSVKPLFPGVWGSSRATLPSSRNTADLVTIGGSGSHKLSRISGRHHKVSEGIDTGSEEHIFKSGVNPAQVSAEERGLDDLAVYGQDIRVTKTYVVTNNH